MSATRRRFSPEALFAISGICQYSGAVIAVRLFDEVRPETVAMFRVALASIPILLISWRSNRRWSRADIGSAAIFGVATALMNLFFYLAIDRLPLGKSVVIEFIGPIAVAAWFTRTRRNTAALLLAVSGVVILSGVEIGGDPLGIFFIFCASMMWAMYIVLARRVASLDRGLNGLGVGLVIGGVFLIPFGARGSMAVLTDANLLLRCFAVAVLSSAIGYGIDQIVLRRIPVRRFAVLLALLPVTAMLVGFIALDQRPSVLDLVGAALVITGVLVQDREELPTLRDELPA